MLFLYYLWTWLSWFLILIFLYVVAFVNYLFAMMATKASLTHFLCENFIKQRILLYLILLSLWAPSKLLNAYTRAHAPTHTALSLNQLFLHFLFKLLNDFFLWKKKRVGGLGWEWQMIKKSALIFLWKTFLLSKSCGP